MVDLDPPKLEKKEAKGDLQDGILYYYLLQAPLQDAQIEARVEHEAFFLNEYIRLPIAERERLRPKGKLA